MPLSSAPSRAQRLARYGLALLALSPPLLLCMLLLHDRVQHPAAPNWRRALSPSGAAPDEWASSAPPTMGRRSRALQAVAPGAPGMPPADAPAPAVDAMPRRERRIRELRKQPMPCANRAGQARSFLMLFMGHSGSSAVISELAAHSRVRMDAPEAVDHEDLENNSTAALIFARKYFREVIAAGQIPAFKMRPRHIRDDPVGWREFAREFETRIIWNYRENVFKQAVGEYSYKKLKDHSVIEGLRSEAEVRSRCSKGAGCTYRIDDLNFFHKALNVMTMNNDLIASTVHMLARPRGTNDDQPLCVHELPYEDYLYDREGTIRAARDFLGLTQEESAPTRHKATKDNMCEVVENWSEVCRAFYACHVWRRMMDDQRNGCTCNEMGMDITYCRTDLYLGYSSSNATVDGW